MLLWRCSESGQLAVTVKIYVRVSHWPLVDDADRDRVGIRSGWRAVCRWARGATRCRMGARSDPVQDGRAGLDVSPVSELRTISGRSGRF